MKNMQSDFERLWGRRFDTPNDTLTFQQEENLDHLLETKISRAIEGRVGYDLKLKPSEPHDFKVPRSTPNAFDKMTSLETKRSEPVTTVKTKPDIWGMSFEDYDPEADRDEMQTTFYDFEASENKMGHNWHSRAIVQECMKMNRECNGLFLDTKDTQAEFPAHVECRNTAQNASIFV